MPRIVTETYSKGNVLYRKGQILADEHPDIVEDFTEPLDDAAERTVLTAEQAEAMHAQAALAAEASKGGAKLHAEALAADPPSEPAEDDAADGADDDEPDDEPEKPKRTPRRGSRAKKPVEDE